MVIINKCYNIITILEKNLPRTNTEYNIVAVFFSYDSGTVHKYSPSNIFVIFFIIKYERYESEVLLLVNNTSVK